MRTAGAGTFLNFDGVRVRHIVRAIAGVLTVVLLGNSVAFAADGSTDPVKVKQTLTKRGVGNRVNVTEVDGTKVSGTLTAIQDDSFQVTPNKQQAVTIPYARVSKTGNGGLGAGGTIIIVVVCVAAAAGIAALVISSALKRSPI